MMRAINPPSNIYNKFTNAAARPRPHLAVHNLLITFTNFVYEIFNKSTLIFFPLCGIIYM